MRTLQTVNNIGLLHLKSDRLDEAEQKLLRALNGLEVGRGATHITTLRVLHNTGILYHRQNKLDDAKSTLEKALEGWTLHGIAKPEADSTYCLAEVYESLSDSEEAGRLFQQAARLYKIAHGPEHAQTLEAIQRAEQTKNVDNSSR